MVSNADGAVFTGEQCTQGTEDHVFKPHAWLFFLPPGPVMTKLGGGGGDVPGSGFGLGGQSMVNWAKGGLPHQKRTR